MGRTAARQKGSRPLFEELEGRVLYSADGIGGLDVGLAEGDDAVLEASLLPTGTAAAHATPDQTARPAIHDAAHRREVAFIDASIPDYQRLIDDLPGADPSGRTIEVVLLDAETDGIARITRALADLGDLDAVHIISHGEDGAIQIGATRLDLMTLETRAEEIRSWGAALGENADLLVYGCDLAGSDAGRALVDAVGALTGADVAAREALTGEATPGGDWALGSRAGDVEGIVAFTAETRHGWSGVLRTVDDPISSVASPGGRVEPNADQAEAPTTEARTERHEIVFIDANVPDHQTLVAALSDDADPARSVEVVVLEPARNGIELVSATLQGRENLDAIHIISHADDGNVRLGSSTLNAETLEQNKRTIALWADAFGESGDILIYGCNLAATESGKSLIDTLSELTRTDVAASDDLTGNLTLGGNWALEYRAGSVETAVALDEHAQQSWSGVLATYTVSSTADAGAGSLRQAITDANSSVGSDTIVFNIPGAGPHTINLAAALPTITDTVTLDGWSEPDHVDVPVVRIDGAAAGAGVTGLTLSGTADNSVIRGLMITDFSVDGVLVESGADFVTIAGNWIGTAGTGTTGVGNGDDGIDLQGSNATIGGTGPNDGNVVTNAGDEGIDIKGSGVTAHVIQGNIIGLDPDGATGSGNADVGIAIISGAGNTIGGTTSEARNVISNSYEGIEVNTDDNIIQGNYIGTDATGTLDRGNRSDDGVEVQSGADGNLIGGTAPGAGNLIAFNARDGVYIASGVDNSILGNRIHSNVGLGIDLASNGVATNDAGDGDGGANDTLNYPVLSTAIFSGGDTTITGTLNSVAGTTFRIEFFRNVAGSEDASGYGEGSVFIGSTSVTTDGSGDGMFNAMLTGVVLTDGDRISATATQMSGGSAYLSTSEFAQNITATGNVAPVINSPGAVSVAENRTVVTTVTASDGNGDTPTFSITGGVDQALFEIDGGTGILTFNPVRDFENPADSDSDNIYVVEVTAHDGYGGTHAQLISVTVTDVTPAAANDGYAVDANATLAVDWWNTDWSRRQEVSFDNLAQAETLTDFPVLVVLDSGSIDYARTNDDGSDLRFFAADGTPLAHEIEQWNEGGDSSVWVRVPQITGASSSDRIWMYYGNASAESTGSSAEVWDASFVGVWHLNEDQAGVGTAGVYQDSTGRGNDGIDRVAATGQDGQVTDGQQLGANDWIEIAHDSSLDLKDSMTISFWIKPSSDSGTFNRVVEKGLWGYGSSYYFGGGNGTNDLTFYLNGQEVIDTADNVLTVGVWQHAAVSYTSNGDGTGTARLYLDGAEIATGSYTNGAVPGNTGRLAIGHDDPSYDFDGFVDEVQISDTDRSADWIAAHYQATRNQLGAEFVQLGAEQPAPGAGGVMTNDVADSYRSTVTNLDTTGTSGLVTLNADGTFSYDPNGQFDYLAAGATATDSFTYTLTDGAQTSTAATVTITITGVNDTPTGAGTLTTTSINDNAGATNLFSGLTVADVDTGESDLSLTITLTNPAAGSLSGGGFTETGPGTGVYTASGLTVAQADTALDGVTFTPTNNTGPSGTFNTDINVTVNDQGGAGEQSVLGATTVTITRVNDAPTFLGGSVGYWHFDEGAGDTTADAAQGVSTGTLGSTAGGDSNDPTWTAGRFGQALHFDGVDDYVEIADDPGIDVTGPEFAASLWMKPDAGPNKEDMLFMKGDRQGEINYYVSWKDTGEMTWAFKDGTGWNWLDMPVTQPTTGEWNHIAISFDRPTVTLYVNGTKHFFDNVATGGSMDRDLSANDDPLWIGAGRSSGAIVGVNEWSGPFTGSIDDLALYDRALSDADIDAIRSSGPPAATATSFALDEKSANTTVVGSVVATDRDAAETLSYAITAGNVGGTFTIDANGQLTVANSAALDFETNPVFNLTVEATDGGTPGLTDTAAVTITLNDVNDDPTGGGTLTTTSLNDNAGATNLLGSLTVSDVDAGESDLSVTITLTNPAAGTLTGGGFTETGLGTGVYTATGLTVAQADTALDNVTFTPTNNTGPSGTFNTDISVTVNDQGGAGEQSVLGATTVTITRVNDNPGGAGTLTTTSLNDNAGATNLFGGLTVADVDSGENDLSVTITLTNPAAGTLSGGGFTETGLGTGVYTATGLTVAQADTALDNVQFTPTNNTGPSGTFNTDISVTVNDQGGAGEQSVLGATTVTITRVNDEPGGAGTLTTTSINDNAGAANLFGGLTVADVDSGENDLSLTITLTDPAAGTVSGGGFTETGLGTGVYTATGLTVVQADTALDTVQFTPTNNTGPATVDISVTVNDQGGGGEQSVLGATTLTITGVNNDPTGAGTLTTTSLNDNAGATNLFGGISISDVDPGENDLSVTITLTNPAAGILTGGGFTETGLGTGVYTATGLTVAQADTALDNVTFTPTNNTGPSGTFNTDISVTVNDQGGAGEQSVLGATTLTVSRVNDAPTGAGTLTATSINDNAGATNLFSGLTVADVDVGESDLSLTITLTNPAAGILTGGGFTETGLGTGVYTATGLTVAQADTALDNVQFTPTNNTGPSGTFNTDISVTVNDQGGGGEQSVLGATTLTVSRVNDAPTGAGTLTATSINDNAGATNLFGSLTVADVDTGENDLSLTITLTNPAAGILTGGGFTETGLGTGVYTATGLTVAQADTALDNVTFTPTNNTGPSGTFNTDISVTVNDQGGAGEQSVLGATTLTVSRVNDAPTGAGTLTATSINDNAGATNLFGSLTVADVDVGESDLSLTITLTNPAAGTVSGGGFTETGLGTGVYTATGLTVAQADTALDNVTFTPTNNTGPSGTFNTDISVTVNDQGGAGEQSVLGATTLTVSRVNDAPTGAGTLTATSINDNAGATNLFSGLTVADVDVGESDLSLTITLTNLAAGILTGGGFTETGLGTGVYTATGLTVAQADTALDNVQFTPTNNTGPSGTFNTDISVTVNDQGGGGEQSVLGATTLTVSRVNDAPTGAGTLTATSINDNAGATNLFGSLTVADVDTGENDLSLTITLTNPAAGILTGGGFTETGLGTGVYTATGLTVAQADTALDNVTFTPTNNTGPSGTFNTDISVTVNDQGGAGEQSVLGATTLTVSRVNDAPTGAGTLTATSINDNAGATNLFSGLTVADVDVGESDLSLTITLTNPAAGTVSGGGFTETGLGTGVYTATGLTVAQADTALDNVTFTPTNNTGPSGTFNTDISVTVNDQGGAGEQSVLGATTLTVSRVNDAPTGAGTLTATSINDNAGATNLFGSLTVADVDTGESDLSLTITLTNPAAGTLSGGGFTETGLGTGVYTATGLTVAQADTALDNVTFTPTNNTGPSGTFNTDISVTVNDQGGAGEQSVLGATTVTIGRINDDPQIISGGGGPTVGLDVAENTNVVTTVGATDVDGATPTFTISGGADQGFFSIGLNSGVLTFIATPDFDSPLDADGNNTYEVEISANDGNGGTDVQTIAVSVTDENTAPAGTPIIMGTAAEGQILSANADGISDVDGLGAYSYQWLRDGVPISGATSATYTLGQTDVSARMSVEVSYTDGSGNPEGPLTSAETEPVHSLDDARTVSLLATEHTRSGSSISSRDIDRGPFEREPAVADEAEASDATTSANHLLPESGASSPSSTGPAPAVLERLDSSTPSSGPATSDIQERVTQVVEQRRSEGELAADSVRALPARLEAWVGFGVAAGDLTEAAPASEGPSTRETVINEALRVAMQSMRTEMADAARLERLPQQVLDAATRITGVSATAGSVTWLMRGSSLFASVLTTVPTWKGFDPLPVLDQSADDNRTRRRKRDEDDRTEDEVEEGVGRVLDAVADTATGESSSARGDERT